MTATPEKVRCPHVPTCELFPKFQMQSVLKAWLTLFCESGFEQCARYRLALQSRPVPVNLLPNGRVLQLPESG